jgi:uncharacterized protein
MSDAPSIAVAQHLLRRIAAGESPDTLAQMFAEDLQFEIQGDDGALPWIGHKVGRDAAAAFFRDLRLLTEPVTFDVEDILGNAERAVIIGALATKIRSSGETVRSQFAIILTIATDMITRFQMLEDSFAFSRAVRGPTN